VLQTKASLRKVMAGTAIIGTDTNSYSTLYRSPHTPSSSPETFSFLRSSPARPVDPAVDRTVKTPAPSKHGGLRTPADSGDLKFDADTGAAAAKAAEFHSQVRIFCLQRHSNDKSQVPSLTSMKPLSSLARHFSYFHWYGTVYTSIQRR
jgi:hypothetical protein